MIALLLLTGTGLWAGPPFRTDDPEPVGLDHAEFYLAGMSSRTADGQTLAAPLLEFNYGLLPSLQFHLVAPCAQVKHQGDPWARGYGDTEIGLKFRFVEERDDLPQVGIFPMVELPTGRSERGLGAGHTAVYLPLWIQRSFGPWTTYGGYGWWRNPGEGQRNWSYTGWLFQREVSERLTVGAEVFRTTASISDGRPSLGWTLGAVANLSERHHILASLGTSLSGPSETHIYLGYQLTLSLRAPSTSSGSPIKLPRGD